MANHAVNCRRCGGDLRANACVCNKTARLIAARHNEDNEASQNPKLIRALKDGKAPLEYLPSSVWPGDARVHKTGADKYGRSNWLLDSILASTYKGAILRHLKAWCEGEDVDPESGEHHFYHIRACCAIVLDSGMKGTLIDDRLVSESKDQG